MRLPKFWFDEVTRSNFYFYIGWNYEKFLAHIKRQFDVDFDNPHPHCAGQTLTVMNQKKGTEVNLIWVKDHKAYSHIVHECIHAAHRTLERIGAKPDFTNDEYEAYLTQTLFEKAVGG